MRRALLALLLLSPAGAHAEGELAARYGDITRQCYRSAQNHEQRIACIGRMAERCMAGEEGGETTLGMSMCASAETDIWDEFLNADYKAAMKLARELDAEEAGGFPEFARRAESLRDAERAWLKFRDAQCGFEYARWGAGSMRHVAGSNCWLEMTARRAIALREIGETMP